MTYESRVTIDLDGGAPNFELRAVRAYHALERECVDVDVSVSSSGNGLHLVGWFNERLSDDEKLKLRRWLADDSNRVEMDVTRTRVGHTGQVLWTRKLNGESDDDFGDVYDALDHIRASGRTSYEFMHDYVQDGWRGVRS